MRFGEWKPIRDNSMSAPTLALVSALSLSQKTAMLDAEAGEPKKTVKKKKYSQVVNVLKESVRATTITKRILDLRINLIVGDLLASVSAVEK